MENILFELLLPSTKSIVVHTIFCPPNPTDFLEIFNENMLKVDTNNVNMYILSYFKVCVEMAIMLSKNTIYFHAESAPNDVKTYTKLYARVCQRHLIKSPTRITFSSSSITDHFVTSFLNIITQWGILYVWLSDHQLFYCTRKITRVRKRWHQEIKFWSFKNH